MNTTEKIDIINRFDSYYAGINNKGAFLLAFNTFLIGAFLIGYNGLIVNISCDYKLHFKILVAIIILLSIFSMLFTFFSIMPYLRSKSIDSVKSNWFFNDIAVQQKQAFIEKINSTTDDQNDEDINNQIYELSVGLKRKHLRTGIALILNIIEIVLLIPLLLIILN